MSVPALTARSHVLTAHQPRELEQQWPLPGKDAPLTLGEVEPRAAVHLRVRACVAGTANSARVAAAQRGELANAHQQMQETAERALLGRALELARGNQARAARWLGISRLTLRKKLLQFGLHEIR